MTREASRWGAFVVAAVWAVGGVGRMGARGAVPAAAWETPTGVSSREEGYQRGLKLLDDERYEAAIATFRAALARPEGEPAVTWQITLGLAWAYQQLGQGAFALGYYDAFLSQLDAYRAGGGKLTRKLRAKRRTARKLMKELRAEVTKTHGLLEVTSAPAGALVTIDGSGAGPGGRARTPYRGYALAGRHVLRITKQGFRADEREVRVAPGKVVVVQANLAPLPPPPAAPVEEPVPGEEAAPVEEPAAPVASGAAPSGLAWAGWTTMGVGVAAVATGATFLVLSRQDASDADGLDANSVNYQRDFDRLSARARDRATVGWICTGVGAAAAVGGLVWALVEGADDGAATSAAASPGPGVTLRPLRGGLAASVSVSF